MERESASQSNWDDFRFGLEQVEGDVFRVTLSGFGGVTLGAATYAVAITGEGRSLHSLQACFLRSVPPDSRAALRVERIADGRRSLTPAVRSVTGGSSRATAVSSSRWRKRR